MAGKVLNFINTKQGDLLRVKSNIHCMYVPSKMLSYFEFLLLKELVPFNVSLFFSEFTLILFLFIQ